MNLNRIILAGRLAPRETADDDPNQPKRKRSNDLESQEVYEETYPENLALQQQLSGLQAQFRALSQQMNDANSLDDAMDHFHRRQDIPHFNQHASRHFDPSIYNCVFMKL